MYEAVAALSTALGTSVPVRKGRCESVCPRNGGVVVKLPDERLKVCRNVSATDNTDAMNIPIPQLVTRPADSEPPPDGAASSEGGGGGVDEGEGEGGGEGVGDGVGGGGRYKRIVAGGQWTRAAAVLVEQECGVEVPERLVQAHQSKHLADSCFDDRYILEI